MVYTPTQAEIDAVNAQFSNATVVTVPNRNLYNIPTATNNSNSSSTQNTLDSTSQTDVVQPSGSNFVSSQLPISSFPYDSTGIPAASTTSFSAAQNYSSIQTTQLGMADATVVTPSGSVSPIDPATLQSSSNVFNNSFSTTSFLGDNNITWTSQPNSGSDKWDRVKLRYKSGHPMAMYPEMLYPLSKTTGLVWLYKPSVQIQSNVDYETLSLTHSIQEIHAFSSNRAAQITVSGQFVSQNVDEALYSLAAIHFMRSASKMSFGTEVFSTTSGTAVGTPIGSPPPVLLLSGYGTLMMNDIPVIITNFSLDLPADVDYIEVPSGPGFGTKIPVSFNLSANLVVQQSPQDMKSFNIDTATKYGIKSWW